jgi:hypothetical protein
VVLEVLTIGDAMITISMTDEQSEWTIRALFPVAILFERIEGMMNYGYLFFYGNDIRRRETIL